MALVYLACFTIIVLVIIKLANGFIVDFIILPIKRNRIYKTQETEDFLFRTKQITKLLKHAVSKWKGCLSIDFREFPEDFYSDIVIGLFVDCPKLSELLETCLNSSGEYDEHLSKLLFDVSCKEFKNEYNILIKSSFPVRNGVANDDVNFNSSEIISLSHFVNSSLEEIIVRKEEKRIAWALASDILAGLYVKNKRWYDVIMLVYYLEIPQEQVAKDQGVEKDVISSRLYRAKQWIRQNYREQYKEVMGK